MFLLLVCVAVLIALLFSFCLNSVCLNCVFDGDVLLSVFVFCFVDLFVCLFVWVWCV